VVSRQRRSQRGERNNVYEIPNRNFQFETNFLTPSLLPPKTPMFRGINTTRFRHVTR
jgi:hypothetical protein